MDRTVKKWSEMIVGAVVFASVVLMLLACITGCNATAGKVTDSASGKNLGLDGYVMLGELETANPETATPQGRLIIGRLTYKSRKVGIPADQKVPTTGYFKATNTESLFGTKEQIIEYDFTAGSDADAKKALEVLEEKRKAAEEQFRREAAAAPKTPAAEAAVLKDRPQDREVAR